MGSSRTLCKDFFKFQREIKSLSDGQARIIEFEDDKCEVFVMEIAPNDGHYKGGKFKFRVDVSQGNWPNDPPIVICQTDIYHPNIDTEFDYNTNDLSSNICVNLLDLDWCKDCSFDDCLQAILFLFFEPNFDDPLSPLCTSDTDFEEFVKISLEGGDVEGRVYETNYGLAENMAAKTQVAEVNDAEGRGQNSADDTKDSTENKSDVELPVTVTKTVINDVDGEPENGFCSTDFKDNPTEIKVCSDDRIECDASTTEDKKSDDGVGTKALTDESRESPNDDLTEIANYNVVDCRKDVISTGILQIGRREDRENIVTIQTVDEECVTFPSASHIDLSMKLIDMVDKEQYDFIAKSKNGTVSTDDRKCANMITEVNPHRAQQFTKGNDVMGNLTDLWKTSAENLSLKVDIDNNAIFRFKTRKTQKLRFLETRKMKLLTVHFRSLCNWIKELVTMGR